MNQAGNQNVAVGSKSMFSNADGYDNTALGFNTLEMNVNGYSNVAVGSKVLNNNSSGSFGPGVFAFSGFSLLFYGVLGNGDYQWYGWE